MKFLIIGCGSIGKRHIRNLLSIGIDKDHISAVDTRDDRLNEVNELGVSNTFKDIPLDQLDIIDCAIICSPTSMHIEQATLLAKNKIHLLVEKPVCNNLDGIENLMKLINDNKLVASIAYIFRFTQAAKIIKDILNSNNIGKILYFRGEFSEYLPDWHPYEDYRSFYMAEKKLGGGSILDQCHIMDLAHYFCGNFKSVMAFNSKISSLDVNADDIAEMIVCLDNDILASIHTDIFGRQHQKSLEIKGEKGNIIWDFYNKSISVFEAETKKIIEHKDLDEDFNESYLRELKNFIATCEGKEKSISPLQDGIDTMKLILAAELSHKNKQLIDIK